MTMRMQLLYRTSLNSFPLTLKVIGHIQPSLVGLKLPHQFLGFLSLLLILNLEVMESLFVGLLYFFNLIVPCPSISWANMLRYQLVRQDFDLICQPSVLLLVILDYSQVFGFLLPNGFIILVLHSDYCLAGCIIIFTTLLIQTQMFDGSLKFYHYIFVVALCSLQ